MHEDHRHIGEEAKYGEREQPRKPVVVAAPGLRLHKAATGHQRCRNSQDPVFVAVQKTVNVMARDIFLYRKSNTWPFSQSEHARE